MAKLLELAQEAVEFVRTQVTIGSTIGLCLFCEAGGKKFILDYCGSSEDLWLDVGEALTKFSVGRYIICAKVAGFKGKLKSNSVLDLTEIDVDLFECAEPSTFIVFFGESSDGEEVCFLYSEDLSEKLVDAAEKVEHTIPRFFRPKLLN